MTTALTRWRRRAALAAVLVTAVTVAVACGGGAGGSSSPQAKTSSQTNTGEHATTQPTANANLNLRYSFPHTGAKSNFTYGVKLGYFKQAGINLTLDDGKGSETTAQTTANGSDDFGTVDGGAWLTVASKGLPAKAVMSVYGGSPNAIIVPADSNIRNPKDLEGKRVAVSAGDAPSALLPILMQKNGADIKKVHLVNLSPSAKLTSLLTKNVDAEATFNTIQATLAVKGGLKTRTLMYADFGVVTPGDYIVASDALIKKHPDVVRRFVGAVKKSITATIKHPDAAVKSFIQHHPDYNKKLAAAQLEDVLPLLKKAAHNGNHPVGWISKQQLVAGLSQLKQAGIIDTPHPAGTYYTNKFVK